MTTPQDNGEPSVASLGSLRWRLFVVAVAVACCSPSLAIQCSGWDEDASAFAEQRELSAWNKEQRLLNAPADSVQELRRLREEVAGLRREVAGLRKDLSRSRHRRPQDDK
jgi:uncharacterized protein YlxW (UPF0749 family)